jgi:hypothetical protein
MVGKRVPVISPSVYMASGHCSRAVQQGCIDCLGITRGTVTIWKLIIKQSRQCHAVVGSRSVVCAAQSSPIAITPTDHYCVGAAMLATHIRTHMYACRRLCPYVQHGQDREHVE